MILINPLLQQGFDLNAYLETEERGISILKLLVTSSPEQFPAELLQEFINLGIRIDSAPPCRSLADIAYTSNPGYRRPDLSRILIFNGDRYSDECYALHTFQKELEVRDAALKLMNETQLQLLQMVPILNNNPLDILEIVHSYNFLSLEEIVTTPLLRKNFYETCTALEDVMRANGNLSRNWSL